MATRDLAAARAAHVTLDVTSSREAHISDLAVRLAPEQHKNGGDHMKSVIFGGLDGCVQNQGSGHHEPALSLAH